MENLTVVLCTIPEDGSADTLALELVEKKLAACVNIMPGLTSIYYWENEICKDQEKLLLIKTTESMLEKVFSFIKEKHPYSVPERLSLAVSNVGKDYLKWANNYINN